MSNPAKRAAVLERIEHVAVVDAQMWDKLKRDLGPISDSYLRSVLRNSGKPLAPVVEGVRTSSLESAKRTLLALASDYNFAADAAKRSLCRNAVIEAKQRLSSKMKRSRGGQDGSVHADAEVLLWVRTWLDNPGVFPDWLAIRERTSGLMPPPG